VLYRESSKGTSRWLEFEFQTMSRLDQTFVRLSRTKFDRSSQLEFGLICLGQTKSGWGRTMSGASLLEFG
jgi:hypothetical protein